MRAEEKELEGPELEREEQLQEGTVREEEQLPELGGEALRDIELEHRSTLFDAIRLVLAGEHVTVSLLYLPQRETQALEALQAAVSGQDSVGEFVFAEDRRVLLEQALAVLQQNVTYGDAEQLAGLHARFDELTERVGELRHRLLSLEDAQEELIESERQHEKAATDAGDKGDKGDEGEGAGDAALDGPERPVEPKPPSTLTGDAIAEAERPPSTLTGDAIAEAERPPSTLTGDAPPEAPRPASELAAEGAAAEAQKPWWSRPFG